MFDGDGFSMLLPTKWTVVTASEMDFEELLERAPDAVDSEEFVQQVTAMFEQGGKIFAFDFLGSGPAFVDNINVLELPLPGLTAEGVESVTIQQFEDYLGATVLSSEIRTVPAGEAVVIWYRIPSTGSEGISVTLLTDTTQWAITLSATDVDALADTFDTIVESFREAS